MTGRAKRSPAADDEGETPARRTGRAASAPASTRLTANLNPATMTALHRLAATEGVTVTEAVRRLVGYGDVIYQAIKFDGDDVLIRRGDTYERIVIV
ncbi:hypothetical protein [Kutzneria chonburiensis]|uniref:Uncharacterized protein n=1 Tax=Kutzneria chonburiensis TaxID=1483604 RepID=A0ABV6N0W9_9PSEU|nr:hypothetical protein [Kutzneria chonburiensis]